MQLRQLAWAFGLLALSAASPATSLHNPTVDRQNYSGAREALRAGEFDQFQALRDQLDHYPLAIYLDYYRLFESSRPGTINDVQEFLRVAEYSPLARRARAKTLERLAAQGAWRDYLMIAEREPVSERLRCFYYQAKLAQGETQSAWQGANQLWLSGEPIDDACDPLFAAWSQNGGRSESDLWARLLLAEKKRQTGLQRYLSKQMGGAAKADADLLLTLTATPEQLARTSLNGNNRRHQDIVARILPRWAAKDATAALAWYQQKGKALIGRTGDHTPLLAALARGVIRQEQEELYPWLDTTLAQLKDPDLNEERARQALRWGDNALLGRTLAQMPADSLNSARWQFWQGRLALEAGNKAEGQRLLAAAANERDFYGFLAADQLGQPYRLNNQTGPLPGAAQLARDPGIQRAEELLALGETELARAEWQNLLSRLDNKTLEALAEWSLRQNWPQLAIAAASKAEAWDRLQLRFPVLYEETFRRYARQHGLPANELMAIARRESALYPQARSTVGARGLMQLMPATAKVVAKRQGLGRITNDGLFDVDTNVALGSAYYRDLLNTFDSNRVCAIAAYNAGPSRVKQWRKGELEAPAWVEAIPFKETRQYVQAVLTYNVVYAELQGSKAKLLSEQELNARY